MMTSNKRSKWKGRVLYILVLLIFQELIFRFVFPIPELQNLDRINYMKLDPAQGSFEHSRNQTWYWESSLDTSFIFEHQMNRYGFRDDEWTVAHKTGKKRVLFIGDSFVEGVMAAQDATIPAAFEAESGHRLEVMNGGMVGVGLDSYLQFTADVVPTYQPDVVFFCIYANDLGQNTPSVPQYFLEPDYFNPWMPRLVEVIRQFTTRGPLLTRWGSSAQPYLPTAENSANPWVEKKEELTPHVSPAVASAMQSGHFNPFRTNALAKEEKYFKQRPKLGETIPFLQYICAESRAIPVVVYIPSRNQITNHYRPFEQEQCVQCPTQFDLTQPQYQLHQQVLAEQCAQFNVLFFDLTPVIKAEEQRGNHLFWNYDEHMRGAGYQLLGKTLYSSWVASVDPR